MFNHVYTRALVGLVVVAAAGAALLGANFVRAQNDESLMLVAGSQQYLNTSGAASPTSAVTIEAWIKVNTLTDTSAMIVQKGDTYNALNDGSYTFTLKQQGENDYRLWGQVEETPNNVRAAITIGSTNFYNLRGQWVHVAMSWSADQPVALYVNGVRETSSVPDIVEASSIYDGGQDVRVGAQLYNGQLSMFFDGMIDDVRIWNVARSDAEILNNKNNELVGNETGLIAYWQFNGTWTGTVVGTTLTPVNGADFSHDIPFNQHGGSSGADGKSAYQLALDNGFVGTLTQWLLSLKGDAGPAGPPSYATVDTHSLTLDRSLAQYLSVDDPSGTSALNVTHSITVEAWFKIDPNAPFDSGTIVSKGYSTSDGPGQYLLQVKNGVLFAQMNDTSRTANVPWTPDVGVWHHVAWVMDSTHPGAGNNGSTFYLDGVFMGQDNGVDDLNVTDNPFFIGKTLTGYPTEVKYFNGNLDEVRVWDYARSQSQILSTMNTELTGTEPGLVGYWKFNNNALDSAGTSNLSPSSSAPTYSTDTPLGHAGAPGPAGPQGPAGMLSGSQIIAGATTTIAANAAVGALSPVATASCPSGKVLLGGGAWVQHPGAARGALSISAPNGASGWAARSVVVLAANAQIHTVPFAVCSQ